LPNDIDGVYFLHSGLRACIEWDAEDAAGKLVLEVERDTRPAALGARELVWDSNGRTWQVR
jgi:hypothetical protein